MEAHQPFFNICLACKVRRQISKLVEALHEIAKQGVEAIHGGHLDLESVHGGDERLHRLRHHHLRSLAPGRGRLPAVAVLDGGWHARNYQSVVRCRAVHVEISHEHLHVRHLLLHGAEQSLEFRNHVQARGLVLLCADEVAHVRPLQVLHRLDQSKQVRLVVHKLALFLGVPELHLPPGRISPPRRPRSAASDALPPHAGHSTPQARQSPTTTGGNEHAKRTLRRPALWSRSWR
mmetsp:Transcript_14781/g.28453  ORF Transcript_14781/g.28453 Transcript_14781/m.28453 type:complete len:234 (-) Transcript_14781:832-1533(-)